MAPSTLICLISSNSVFLSFNDMSVSLFHSPACNHTGCFTSNGNLTSANYPNPYYSNTADSWLITAPEGQKVTLNFVDFSLEEDKHCTKDYVILYDGDSTSDPQIGDDKYCGTNFPSRRQTSSNNLLLTFTSNDKDQARGISAMFYFGGQCEYISTAIEKMRVISLTRFVVFCK